MVRTPRTHGVQRRSRSCVDHAFMVIGNVSAGDFNPRSDVLNNTPCVAPGTERRCLGNIAQSCQNVSRGMFFRSVQGCTATSSGGNFVQMCQRSTGQCCTPGNGNNCQ